MTVSGSSSGSNGSAERVDEWIEEVKTSAEEGDYEVKKLLDGITESTRRSPLDLGNLETVNILPSFFFVIFRKLTQRYQQLTRLESLISLPASEDQVTTPLAALPARLRIRQTIFRTEKGFEAMRRVVGSSTGLAFPRSPTSGGPGKNGEAEDLPIVGLKNDESGVVADDKAGCETKTQCLGRVLRILHVCLANEQSRMYFDVSRVRIAKDRILISKCHAVDQWMGVP